MIVLAFLQNQWFHDPARHQAVANGPHRLAFIRRALFYRCLTGRRLLAALGEDWCNRIVWENTTRSLADRPCVPLPPDLHHMRQAIDEQEPDVTICFGRVAANAWAELHLWACGDFIQCPHPAGRGLYVLDALRQLRTNLDGRLADALSVPPCLRGECESGGPR